jgi:hypothetical protein
MSAQDLMRTAGSGVASAFNGLSDLFYRGFDKLFTWIGSFFQGDGAKSGQTSKSLTSSSVDQDTDTRYQPTADRMRSRRREFSLASNNGTSGNYGMNSNNTMPASMQTSYPASRTSYSSNMGGQQFASNVMPRFNENSLGMRRGFGGPQMAFAHGGGCHFGGGGRGHHR